MTRSNKKKAALPLNLDIACGQTKGTPQADGTRDSDGWTGIDISETDATDIVHDLNSYPWPFEDNSVDRAMCSHYIEHIPHDIPGQTLDGFILFMNECGRILKPGAQLEVWSPYYSSARAPQDPTHRRAVSEGTFLYCNQEWLKNNGLDHYGVTCDFDFSYGYRMSNPRWTNANDETRTFAISHYWNVVDDIYVTLTKR